MSRDLEEAWSPEYDSTWEEEEGEEKHRGHKEPGTRRQPNTCRKWTSRAARDLQNYRHGYENDKSYQFHLNQSIQMPNLEFYQNKRRFEPEGLCIGQLFNQWKQEYGILERNHSYIQWLFPLREYGMNSCAKPLTKAEIEVMKKDAIVQERFLTAYKLMLNFYGISLEDERTGKVTRAENWEDRFRNLNDHSHNNLRITRILKCLGELGFEHYQAPLVKFFLEETLCNGKLQNVKRSVLDYFMFTVKNKIERQKLVHFAWKHYNQERFIWGPVEILKIYQPPAENEPEIKNCQKETKDERDVESKINGLLDSCEKNVDKEEIACREFIPLGKVESNGKYSDEISTRVSKTESENKKDLSSSSNPGMNGVFTENISPKHDHKVPAKIEHQKQGIVDVHSMDVTGEKNNPQQDTVHKNSVNMPSETQRKRKMSNETLDREAICPQKLNDFHGLLNEGGEGHQIDSVGDKVKKLKVSENPILEENPITFGDQPSNIADRPSQQSGEVADLIQEEEHCDQLDSKNTKEEMPKLHEMSNSDNCEKTDDDPSLSSVSADLK